MRNRTSYTQSEIKALLLARTAAKDAEDRRFYNFMQKHMEGPYKYFVPTRERHPEAVRFDNELTEWMADLQAKRLFKNDRSVPLATKADVTALSDRMRAGVEARFGKADGDDKAWEENFLREHESAQIAQLHTGDPALPYEDFWKWLGALEEVAVSYEVTPTEVFTKEAARDDLTRRSITKEEFARRWEKLTTTIISDQQTVDRMINTVVEREMSGHASRLNRTERKRLSDQMRTAMRQHVKDAKPAMSAAFQKWIDTETRRIYGN